MSPATPNDARSDPPASGTGLRVVVLDDDRDDLELTASRLERELPGLQVDRLGSSELLEQVLERGSYDVVVTALDLGWTDGLSVLRTVKGVNPDCPVILYTGTASDAVVAAGMEAGLDDFVLKSPAGAARLPAAVREALERVEAERRATLLRTRMRGLLTRLRVGVFQATPEGLLMESNPAFRRLLGLRAPELHGDIDLASLFGDPEEYHRLVHRLDDQRQVRAEVDFVREDGATLAAAVTMVLTAGDDEPAPIEGLIEDFSARRRAVADLRESQARLRQLAGHLQSVREEERARIAGQVHDELGQALTALKMELSWVGKRLVAGDGEPAQRIRYMSALIDETIGKVRRISGELHPRLLDEFGLVAAIEWQAKDLLERSDIACALDLDEELSGLDPEMGVSLFRIVQELLTNVLRHAEAGRVEVRLGRDGGDLVLAVSDDGHGFRPEEVSAGRSFGLLELEERARLWGGAVEVDSRPGQGARVEVRIPLDREGDRRGA
jgi:two-component system sensor histidine kinase UhpB